MRERVKFALLPVRLTSGRWVWLGRYVACEVSTWSGWVEISRRAAS